MPCATLRQTTAYLGVFSRQFRFQGGEGGQFEGPKKQKFTQVVKEAFREKMSGDVQFHQTFLSDLRRRQKLTLFSTLFSTGKGGNN